MDHLSTVIRKVMHKRGLGAHADASLVVHKAQGWLQQAFPHFSEHIHADTFKDGTLFLSAEHSIALQECQGRIPEMLSFLQRECPFAKMNAIRMSRS